VQGQEILIAATSARDPVVLGRWLEPGQHLNAVGANQIARRELDTEGVVRSHVVVVDSKEQARIESGDLMLPISEGQLAWEDVLELMELVAGRASGRKTPQDITLFKSFE
jgi:ornithine cyclodeaminase/alanine dehydrogenase-like protein (mu-crystallin family)